MRITIGDIHGDGVVNVSDVLLLLDGYLNVFWNEDPNQGIGGMLASILPQLGVLAGMTAMFLLVARLLARRWEVV